MARPKSTDAKVPLTIRLPVSAMAWWETEAKERGKTIRAYIEDRLTTTAQRAQEAPDAG
jgi:hypothetical protein